MKKNLFFAAFALLATCLTFTLTACGDDDDDDKGGATKVTEYGEGIDVTDGVLVYSPFSDGAVYVRGFAENAKVPSALKIPAKIKYQGLENTVVGIGNGAFNVDLGGENDPGLKITSVSLPNTLEWIEGYAFYGCANLTSISFPDALKQIGTWAFARCEALEKVDLNKVECIEYAAFYSCTSLARIKIPATVETIASCAFGECNKLQEIVVDENNPYYDSRNNCNAIIETSGNVLHTACRKTVIPEDVETIGKSAYEGADMTSFTIPSHITEIANYAFYGCYNLTSIVLHEKITKIGKGAFEGCDNLTDVYCLRSVASSYNADKNAFGGEVTIDKTLHVTSSMVKLSYQNKEPWSRFKSIKTDAK